MMRGSGKRRGKSVSVMWCAACLFLICGFCGCGGGEEMRTARRPAFWMDGILYVDGSSSKLIELPQGYVKVGVIEKEIPSHEEPVEERSINCTGFLGCEIYKSQSCREKVYMKRNDVYEPWIISDLSNEFVCLDGKIYRMAGGEAEDPERLPEGYTEIGILKCHDSEAYPTEQLETNRGWFGQEEIAVTADKKKCAVKDKNYNKWSYFELEAVFDVEEIEKERMK